MLVKTLYFLAGAAVGGIATYLIVNKTITQREKDRADKEIKETKEMYKKKYGKVSAKADEVAKRNDERKEELLERLNNASESAEYERIRSNYDRTTYMDDQGHVRRNTIQVITPDERDDPKFEDFHKESDYFYYTDSTVSNELDEELDDYEVENSVGYDFMEFFRDNPNVDECYVRNFDRRTDYTIQRVNKKYDKTIDPNDDTEGEE